MPFVSRSQMKAAFSGALGPEMKKKASHWAHETKDIRNLPERKGMVTRAKGKKRGLFERARG